MSLRTIVDGGLASRLLQHPRRARAAVVPPPAGELGVLLSGPSMRILETGLAVTAIATALLMGLGR